MISKHHFVIVGKMVFLVIANELREGLVVSKFIIKNEHTVSSDISSVQIRCYHKELVVELKKQGATNAEINLVNRNLIINSIRRNRKPEDVAWAILQ